MKTLPELLAPAGNLEKLRIAFNFGADAVFVGGFVFGLRKYADNFTLDDLQTGIALANELSKHVYVVLNGFAHQDDIDALIPHLLDLERIMPHGLIISDMGVFQLAKRYTTIPLHVSTQASVTHPSTCQMWANAGAHRIILAREVTLADCKEILKQVPIELEVFVHGAMCASYSGKCVISNYTAGRDSNRGGCIQSCRHGYWIEHDGDSVMHHIMNAKDLNALRLIPDIIDSGVCSLKIEGRMKSNLYVANTVRAYRRALDAYVQFNGDRVAYDQYVSTLNDDLDLVSNRQFSTGAMSQDMDDTSINAVFGHYEKGVDYIGTVKMVEPGEAIYVSIKAPFLIGDTLTLLQRTGERVPFVANQVAHFTGETISKINPNMLIRLPWVDNAHPLDVVYKAI